MKGVTLYPHIKFLPLEDADGYFGLMMMTDKDDNIVTTATIEDAVEYQLNESIVWLAIQNNSSLYLEFLREQDK